MLKFLASLIERLIEPADVDQTEIDPLLHPALQRMTERELADLPFGSIRTRSAGQSNCPA